MRRHISSKYILNNKIPNISEINYIKINKYIVMLISEYEERTAEMIHFQYTSIIVSERKVVNAVSLECIVCAWMFIIMN